MSGNAILSSTSSNQDSLAAIGEEWPQQHTSSPQFDSEAQLSMSSAEQLSSLSETFPSAAETSVEGSNEVCEVCGATFDRLHELK